MSSHLSAHSVITPSSVAAIPRSIWPPPKHSPITVINQRVAAVVTPTIRSPCRRMAPPPPILEQYKGSFRPLIGIEYLSKQERGLLREIGTPLTVAYGDSVLREVGLASDRLGDATAFFDLANGQAHYLLCNCYYRDSMTTGVVAARVHRSPSRSLCVKSGARSVPPSGRGGNDTNVLNLPLR